MTGTGSITSATMPAVRSWTSAVIGSPSGFRTWACRFSIDRTDIGLPPDTIPTATPTDRPTVTVARRSVAG
jgi:hypothetical protein